MQAHKWEHLYKGAEKPKNAKTPPLTSPPIPLALCNLRSTSRCVISFSPLSSASRETTDISLCVTSKKIEIREVIHGHRTEAEFEPVGAQ